VDDSNIQNNTSNSKLVQYDESTLEVVSIGVGTKILPKRKVIDEFRCSRKTGTTLFIHIIVWIHVLIINVIMAIITPILMTVLSLLSSFSLLLSVS
jgi:hypothetical protein